MAQGNLVAKHMNKTSRAVTHRDRRKDEKRGYRKHAKAFTE